MLIRRVTALFGIASVRFSASQLTGAATVVDGDSLIIEGERVRLHGIDAPELDQTFWCRGRHLPCGAMAMSVLEALTAGVALRCELIERDRHGRLIAKCYSPNGVDVGRRMVSAGWALAYRNFSSDYIDAENEAREAKRGLWKGTFIKPWLWRAALAAEPNQTTTSVSVGVVVKL